MGPGIGAIFSLASMGFNYSSQMAKAKGEKAAADAQADKLKRAADYGRTRADQTTSAMTEDLNNTLGAIESIRAAAGADPTSPTTAAVRERQSFIGSRKKNIQVGNILAQAGQDDSDADYLRRSGAYAMEAGSAGAFGGLLKGFGSFFGGFGGG